MSNARFEVPVVGMRVGAVGSLAAAAGLLVVAGASSAGAAAPCPTGASEVSPGVCSVTLTSSGSFTAPAGVTTLEALLVGGGGAGSDGCTAYVGGAAGSVTYVSSISTAGPVSVTVGAGGVTPTLFACDATDVPGGFGSNTSITDAASVVSTATGGAYAGGVKTTGVLPSSYVASLSGTASLWPAFAGEACFHDDGMDGFFSGGPVDDPDNFSGNTHQLPCGGGVLSDATPNNYEDGGDFAAGLAATGSGGAAFAYFYVDGDGESEFEYQSPGGNGGSGFVTFRYVMPPVAAPVTPPTAAVTPELAATGAATTGFGWASAALTALGLAFVGASRRGRVIAKV